MTPHVVRIGDLSGVHLAAQARAQVLVDRLSAGWGDELRCHELARAVRQRLAAERPSAHDQLLVVDGLLRAASGRCIQHSWLLWPDGVVLDVYRPGCWPQVMLVCHFLAGDYEAGASRRDVDRDLVRRLAEEMCP